MRLNQLLQLCVFALLLMPLVGISPQRTIDSGYDVAMARLFDALDRADSQLGVGDTIEALKDLLKPSARSIELSQANVDRQLRRAENGYRLLRRITGNALERNFLCRPARDLARLADAVPELRWDNLERAIEDPLRLPAGLTWEKLGKLLSRG